MNKPNRLISLVTLCAISSCINNTANEEVSIVELLATPEQHLSQTIVTQGFLRLNDQPRIFLTRDDAIYQNTANALNLKFDEASSIQLRDCNQSYVILSGVLRARQTIDSIQYIYGKDLSSQIKHLCWEKQSKQEERSYEKS